MQVDIPNQHLQEDEVKGSNKKAKEDKLDEGTAIILKQELDLLGSKLKRSTRASWPVSRLKPNMSGKLYMQDNT
jgi:hypothetical protein